MASPFLSVVADVPPLVMRTPLGPVEQPARTTADASANDAPIVVILFNPVSLSLPLILPRNLHVPHALDHFKPRLAAPQPECQRVRVETVRQHPR